MFPLFDFHHTREKEPVIHFAAEMGRPRSNSSVTAREFFIGNSRRPPVAPNPIRSFPSNGSDLGSNPASERSTSNAPVSSPNNSSSSISFGDFESTFPNGVHSERSDAESNSSSLSISDPNFAISKVLSQSDPILEERRQTVSKEEAEKNFKKAISTPLLEKSSIISTADAEEKEREKEREREREKEAKRREKVIKKEKKEADRKRKKEDRRMDRYIDKPRSQKHASRARGRFSSPTPMDFLSHIGSLVGANTSPKGASV